MVTTLTPYDGNNGMKETIMRLFIIALLLFFYGCTQPPEEQDPNMQQYDCYGTADGGHVCNPI